MNAAANEAPQCLRCSRERIAADRGGWCHRCFDAQRAKLSAAQRVLLARAFERHKEVSVALLGHGGLAPSITLETEAEVRAGLGLARRKLCSTYRPTRGDSILGTRRALPGTTRTLRLTDAGLAMARELGPVPRRYVIPSTNDQLRGMLRRLAVAVLEDVAPRYRLTNQARAVLDRLNEEDA